MKETKIGRGTLNVVRRPAVVVQGYLYIKNIIIRVKQKKKTKKYTWARDASVSRASLSCYGHGVLWWLWLKKKNESHVE